MSRSPGPPRFARFLLRFLAPAWLHDDLLGELHEGHETVRDARGPVLAGLWAIKEALLTPFRYAIHFRGPQLSDGIRSLRGGRFGLRNGVLVSMRTLGRNPSFAIPSILGLAVGVGATSAVAVLAYTVLFRPLPFQDEDRLVVLYQGVAAEEGLRDRLSYP